MNTEPEVFYKTLNAEIQNAFFADRIHVVRRMEILESDGATVWRDDLGSRMIEGSISVDSSRDERRVFDAKLDNRDGALRHAPGGFWYDKILRFFRGIRFYDSQNRYCEYETCVGTFMIDSISSQNFPSTLSVSGRDFTKKLLNDQVTAITTFAKGTKVSDIIKAVAANGGITKTKIAQQVEDMVIGADATIESGTSRWEAISEVANGLDVELYFDQLGYLVAKKFVDVSTAPQSIVIRDKDGMENLFTYSKSSSDARIKNSIIVNVQNKDTDVSGFAYSVKAEVTDANSPTSIAAIGRRTDVIESPYIASKTDAQAMADRRLSVASLEDYDLSFTTTCLPWLEAGSVARVDTNGYNDLEPARFLLTSFDIPLSLGPMSGSGKRIALAGTSIGVDDATE